MTKYRVDRIDRVGRAASTTQLARRPLAVALINHGTRDAQATQLSWWGDPFRVRHTAENQLKQDAS